LVAVFQLWIASLFFIFGWGVFNDTEARSIPSGFCYFPWHRGFPAARTKAQLGLGISCAGDLLAYLVYGCGQRRTPTVVDSAGRHRHCRNRCAFGCQGCIPLLGMGLGAGSVLASALYFVCHYREIFGSGGAPNMQDTSSL